jgi:hypothetical protein
MVYGLLYILSETLTGGIIRKAGAFMDTRILRRRFISFASGVLLMCGTAYAGNIDPGGEDYKYAWGENIGWINLEPTLGLGVTVTDAAVTGSAWSENAGWITFDPAFGGVVNDGSGNLSGYAWGENVGWISFSCEDRGTCAAASYGVVIGPCDGTFSGMAWGENIGWVSFFSSGAAPFQIVTAWRLDTDDDGTPDCSDNCPSDPAKTEPGACGCGTADTDTDGDGTPDCNENSSSGGGGGSGCFINSVVQCK